MLPILKNFFLTVVLKIFWAEVSIFWVVEVLPCVLPELFFFMQNLKLISHGTLHRNLLSRNFINILPQSHNMNLQYVRVCYIGKPLQVSYFHLFFVWVFFFPPSSVYYPKWTQALLDTTMLCYKRSFVSVQDWPICHEQFNLYCFFLTCFPN